MEKVKYINDGGFYYQVEESDGSYFVNYANMRGIRKGHMSRKNGVLLPPQIIKKAITISNNIEQEINDLYEKMINRTQVHCFDRADYRNRRFNSEFKKLLNEVK